MVSAYLARVPPQVRAALGGAKADSYWEEPGCRSRGDAEGNLLTVPCQVERLYQAAKKKEEDPPAVSSQVECCLSPILVAGAPRLGLAVAMRAQMW